MRTISIILLSLLLIGCDYLITGPTVTNNNSNNNQNNIDLHDLIDFTPTNPPSTTPPGNEPTITSPLAIPPFSEGVARSVPTTNIGTSCHNSRYLDAVISALSARDSRWGYICKTSCSEVSGDTIAYRATNTNTGVWAVDIIGNHCGTNPSFTWNVVGYAPERMWVGSH